MNGEIQMVQATRHAVRYVWRCVDITAARWSSWLISLTSWRAAVVVVLVFAARNLLAISCVVLSDLFASLSPPHQHQSREKREANRKVSICTEILYFLTCIGCLPPGWLFRAAREGGDDAGWYCI